MILVTGATGTVGGLVLARLPAGRAVRVLARQPERVTAPHPSVEVVRGDYGDQASLERALQGVSRVLLVTNPSADGDARFIRVARRAGVEHVVKLSAANVGDPLADDLITQWQRRNEELLLSSGLAWTLLRPRSFMSNTLSWAPAIRAEGTVRALYGTFASACVDPRDVAEVAVRTLIEDGHEGRAYTLTGPEALSSADQTEQLGKALGLALRFEELAPDQARSGLLQRYPEDVAEALLHSAHHLKCGAKARVENTVFDVTGRAAGPFRAWAEDHTEAFAGGPAGAEPELSPGPPRRVVRRKRPLAR
ncbi:SDR family oxidoreductase [Streptomyces violascens]|uniref:SDR family oxidoreductase n=1 Tax=Streptomyces violascens TaxID=67381 RepID=UPI0036A28075